MRTRREALRLLLAAGPALVGALAGCAALEALVPVAITVDTGALVGAAASRRPVVAPLAFLALLLLVQQCLAPTSASVAYRTARRVDGAVRTRLMRAVSRPLGVDHLEDPAFLDRLARAGDDAGPFVPVTPGQGVVALVSLAGRYVRALASAAVVARFSALAAMALLVTSIAGRIASGRWSVATTRAFHRAQRWYRVAGYTSQLATAAPAAKEARVYGLLPWLLPRHSRQWTAVTSRMSARRHARTRRMVLLHLLQLPVPAAVLILAGVAAVHGGIGPGVLTAVLGACINLAGFGFQGADDDEVHFGLDALPALRDVERRTAAPVGDRADRLPAAATDMPREEIRFDRVAFAYPGGRVVYAGLDLVIPAGESLALVGVNGAGKTTLAKLLARLHEPAAGCISVDGTPLTDIDPASWRARLAVIFQDFTRYELPAADNVGFGAPRRPRAPDALRGPAGRAGVLETVEALPAGWSTVLSRQFTGGADLSGGQWQRIALARALFAVEAGARILVLDEPTANLDVRAEAELFDRYLDLTRGLTTILISHRFSTVRRADRIAVLHEGRVVESGTHDELLAAGGRYATMFRLQAARFHA